MSNQERLGPASVRAAAPGRAMSGPRAAVLEFLQRRPGVTTIAELATALAVHPNTVRLHLDALVDSGLVVRAPAAAEGRGRPAWRYSASADRVEPDSRVRDYAGLATALAAHIARTSSDPAADAVEAGRTWGRDLAGVEGEPRHTPVEARRAVVDLLDELGFAPIPDDDAGTVALRRCPLLDAAQRHPDVVCGVHLGLVRGALDVLGGESDRTALEPFAEPGACRLTLMPAVDRSRPRDSPPSRRAPQS